MMKAVCESFDTGSMIDFAQAAAKDVKDSREINVVRPSIRIQANEPKTREISCRKVEAMDSWIWKNQNRNPYVQKKEDDINEARIYLRCMLCRINIQ